jgi:CRISPR/Cas system CMR subunit Cmr6 (Cas7 group RAMP superfamily)
VIEHQLRRNERRQLCLGETLKGRLLTFGVTERQGKIRFITAYPMHHGQRRIYRGEP